MLEEKETKETTTKASSKKSAQQAKTTKPVKASSRRITIPNQVIQDQNRIMTTSKKLELEINNKITKEKY